MPRSFASPSVPPPRRLLPRGLRLATVAAGAILAMSAVLNVSAATAHVAVPAKAAPDAKIAVSGTGFSANQVGVLTYNGAVVTTFSASGAGSFSAPFNIPDWAAMNTGGSISARTASGSVIASSTLTIGAAVTRATLFAPSAASPGATIVVQGAGFKAGQAGILTINGRKITTFTASTTGLFDVPFLIPNTTVLGTGRISAKRTTKSLLATTTLTIATAIPGVVGPPSPTPAPTTAPTARPSTTSSPSPTGAPTSAPTAGSTAAPTTAPSPTTAPTAAPTAVPTAPPTPSPTLGPTPPPNKLPNFSHVYIIMFENHEYSSIIGSSQAPYINSLAARYGLATNDTAVSHPSEPNYIALTSGSTQGITDDGVYNLSVANIFDQVQASGRTWHAYQQGYPGNCSAVSSAGAVVDGVGLSGSYVRKHDPAISFTSISGNSAKCANITNLASFNPAAANFEFITPNLINDMHDGTVADGDNFLKAFLPQITSSAAFANSVVFVTFDEGTSSINGGGHIATIAITPNMTPGYQATAAYSHYSLLRTVEQAWGLSSLGNAASATAMQFPW